MHRASFLSILLGTASAAAQQTPQRDLKVKPVAPKGDGKRGAGAEPQTRDISVAAPSSGRRRALCIGNNGYRYVRPLRNALNDAESMHRALTGAQFDAALLTEAPLSGMRDAITRFTNETLPGDTALVFFAGHGFQLEGGNFLVPTDFQAKTEEQAKQASLMVEAISTGLVKKRARTTVLLLDACRNNPFRENSAEGLAPVAPLLGAMMMFATAAGRTADDNVKGSNGLFTSKLLAGFGYKQPLQTIARKVRDDVFDASQGRQRPYVQEDLVGDFYLSPVSSAPPQETQGPAPAPVSPKSVEGLLTEGLTQYRGGGFEAAFAAFDRATRIDPGNLYAWNAAGAALAQLGRQAQAVDCYGKAIEADPAYIAAYVNRGLAFLSVPQYPAAIKDFSWAIGDEDSNPMLYQFRGQAYLGARNYEAANEDLDRAVTLDPGSPVSFRIRGRIRHRLGRHPEALEDFNQALRLRPSYWQTLEDRALTYRALGNAQLAAADERAADAAKRSPAR
jgi:tetratricopeptide (TPR) repeat protein